MEPAPGPETRSPRWPPVTVDAGASRSSRRPRRAAAAAATAARRLYWTKTSRSRTCVSSERQPTGVSSSSERADTHPSRSGGSGPRDHAPRLSDPALRSRRTSSASWRRYPPELRPASGISSMRSSYLTVFAVVPALSAGSETVVAASRPPRSARGDSTSPSRMCETPGIGLLWAILRWATADTACHGARHEGGPAASRPSSWSRPAGRLGVLPVTGSSEQESMSSPIATDAHSANNTPTRDASTSVSDGQSVTRGAPFAPEDGSADRGLAPGDR